MSSFNYFDAFANIMGTGFSKEPLITISKQEYEIFCKEYTFERLKGEPFGRAFCKRFDIDDYFLKNLSDKTARYHIEKLGYIK